MMKKRMTAAFLAALMSISLCACGDDDPAAEISSVIDKTAEEVTAEAEENLPEETEAPETENKEAESEDADSEETDSEEAESGAPADPDELAEVQKVVDTYFKALKEKDYDTLLEVTDVELIYYLSEGKAGTRENYIDCLRERVVTGDTAADNLEVTAPKLSDEYIGQYTEFFEMMDEMSEGETAFTDTFKIDRAYAVRMKASGSAEASAASDETDSINFDINVSGDYNIDIDMPVIHVNGEWKCDPAVHMAASLIRAFSSMADSLSESEAE
ncbi:MAG: hypothetical protein IKH27_14850 [Oscillospiraceae bacterium]|nr:hypothetical protein [Oscillospiraceae bacterium]